MRRNLNYIVSLCIDSYFYWVFFYLFYSCWWFTFCFTPVSSQSKWPSTKSLNHFYKRLFSSMAIETRLEMLMRFSYTQQRFLTMEKVIFPNPGSGPELDNIFRCSSTKRWLTFYFMVDDRVGREENVDVAVVHRRRPFIQIGCKKFLHDMNSSHYLQYQTFFTFIIN